MATAGRILIIPKGNWDATTTYEHLDLVTHDNRPWLAKKASVGIAPSDANAEYWHDLFGVTLTASDVGALPIEGGTVAEGVNFEGGYISLFGDTAHACLSSNKEVGDTNGTRQLLLFNTSVLTDKKYSLQLRDWNENTYNAYNIFGEHNKPSGYYTGNGSATERIIDVGGYDNNAPLLYIYSQSTGIGGFVSRNDAMFFDKSGVTCLGADSTHYENGKLYISTDSHLLNRNGSTYQYRTLV